MSLGQGIPSFFTPDHIREAALRAIKDDLVSRYSMVPGLLGLREEVCRKLATFNSIGAEPNEILITVGASEALIVAILALIEEGDEVLLPTPSYPAHIQGISLAGGRPVYVPLVEDENWKLVPEELEKQVTVKTKAMLLCSPLNPTGTVFAEEDLRRLAEIALKHNLWVITDETYEFLTYDGIKHFSIASIPELRGQVISCFSLSKTYAMTGWRVGYMLVPIGTIDNMVMVHDAIAICAPVPAQYAALAALRGPQDCIQVFRNELAQRRDIVCERLDKLGIFGYQKPYGAYYVFPRIERMQIDSVEFSVRLLREANVMTVPGKGFGPTGEGHIRFSFAGPREVIERGFDRLESWLRKTQKRKVTG